MHSCQDLVVTPDSLKVERGAIYNQFNTQRVQGNDDERQNHINALDLIPTYLVLKAFTKGKSDIHVQIRVDNCVTKAQINKMGTL